MRLERLAEEYLKTTPLEKRVKAYALEEVRDLRGNMVGCNVIEGEGYISSDNSWNYHNNYDDSEPTLWFIRQDKKGSIDTRWWSVSKKEVKKECDLLLNSEIKKLEERVETLKTYITQ